MYFTVTDNYSNMLRDAELPEHIVCVLAINALCPFTLPCPFCYIHAFSSYSLSINFFNSSLLGNTVRYLLANI